MFYAGLCIFVCGGNCGEEWRTGHRQSFVVVVLLRLQERCQRVCYAEYNTMTRNKSNSGPDGDDQNGGQRLIILGCLSSGIDCTCLIFCSAPSQSRNKSHYISLDAGGYRRAIRWLAALGSLKYAK